MLQIVHLRCRSFFLVVAEAEFGWKTLEYWPFVYDCSFEIIHCLSLCKFVLCLLTHPSCFAAVVEHMQSPRVGPPEPLTTPISISRNLNYGIPRVHDKWHHHALFDKYRCIPNGGTCNYSVVQSLLPKLLFKHMKQSINQPLSYQMGRSLLNVPKHQHFLLNILFSSKISTKWSNTMSVCSKLPKLWHHIL